MITTLQVEPLLVYNIPQYPAFDEENPLHLPPKKVSKANFYKMALLGVVGLFAIAPNTNVQAQNENPIKFKDLGFPHTYASYGTGLPSRLDKETAVNIIDSVFRANDIEFQKNYTFSEEAISFNATAYNEEKRIGYVWLDGSNTTQDCYRSWSGELKAIELNGNYSQSYNQLMELQKNHRTSSELYKEIQEYVERYPDKSVDNYGAEILKRYDERTMSMEEMKKLLKTDGHYIAPFSGVSSIMEYYWRRDVDSKKIAIKRLENLVQEYINWAKSEGRF